MKVLVGAIALALSGCVGSDKPPRQHSVADCSAHLRQMTARDMAEHLIGQRIEYGGFGKCSGDFVVTSDHWLLLRPNKTAIFQRHRVAAREGRYFFQDNRLCVAFPKLVSRRPGGRVDAHDEDVVCHSAFIDGDGVWYLKGELFHGSLDDKGALAAIKLEPAD